MVTTAGAGRCCAAGAGALPQLLRGDAGWGLLRCARGALLRCGRGGAAEGGGLDVALVLLPGTAGARAATHSPSFIYAPIDLFLHNQYSLQIESVSSSG